jgi:hypothetical protein
MNEQDLYQEKTTTRSKSIMKQKQDSIKMVFSTMKQFFYWAV